MDKTANESRFANPFTVSLIRHMRRMGIPAGFNSRTGAARPKWRDKEEGEEEARQSRRRRLQ